MNKLLKAAAATLIAASASLAAPSFGVHADAGIGGFNGNDAKEIDFGMDFSIGATMVMPLAEKLSLNPQLLFAYRAYSQTKSFDDGFGETSSIEADGTDMALEVPILFRYDIAPAIFVQAGPQLGYLLSSEMKAGSETVDVLNERAKFEYGIAIGAGYKISEALAVDLKYNFGLNAVDKDGDLKASPYQLQLGASYLF